MKYKYSKIRKKENEFAIIRPYVGIDGFDIRDLTLKHNSHDQKVIILQKDKVGRNVFSSTNPRNLDDFNEFESFDNLDWKTDFIERKLPPTRHISSVGVCGLPSAVLLL